MKIVGIGGLPRSGKDTLAEVFMDNGYFGVSLGDIVRNASRERHKDKEDPISVANMTETSNYLRTNYGPDFAMKQAKKLFKTASEQTNYTGLVVYSVRAQVEVDFILEHSGYVVWLETPDEVRYQRYTKHMREGETAISLADLRAHESLQWIPQKGVDPLVQMHVKYVKEHATHVFENSDNDLHTFEKRAKKLLKELN